MSYQKKMFAKGEPRVLKPSRGNGAAITMEEEKPFSLYLTDSDSDGEGRNLEPIRPTIPDGFSSPNIELELSDCLQVHAVDTSQIQVCVAPTIYSPSELYLALAKHFPARVNAFSERMTSNYTTLSRQPRRFEYIANKNLLGPNSIVAVYRRDVKEWARAVVCDIVQTEPEYSYRVQLIDFGEYWDVSQHDILYLRKSLIYEPLEIVKCRLHLSSYYQKYHSGDEPWPREVNAALYDALCDKKFQTKFVRLITSDNDRVWEVSLESICDSTDNRWRANVPIQQQIIENFFGEYQRDDPAFDSQTQWIENLVAMHSGERAYRSCSRSTDVDSELED